MHICVSLYIYIYTYIEMKHDTHVYIHIHLQMYTHVNTCVYIHTYICVEYVSLDMQQLNFMGSPARLGTEGSRPSASTWSTPQRPRARASALVAGVLSISIGYIKAYIDVCVCVFIYSVLI